MDVTEHGSRPAELAARLVNALTPGERRGQQRPAPAGPRLREAVADAVADRPNRARSWAAADDAEHRRLTELALRWREVFERVGEGADTVAPLVNRLLQDAPVRPVLADHDGSAWHLHAHGDGADPADALAAICALGLAEVVAAGRVDRLGTCAADSCDGVFVDTSRNGSRRYCSAACQGRTKTAAFRARRSGP